MIEVYNEIIFRPGVNYVLVIDTDTYAGNIERELAAYAVGVHDRDRGHGSSELEIFEEDAESDPVLQGLIGIQVMQKHEEYDEVSNTIWPTPGRLNNGVGVHFDDDGKSLGYPAYESVAMFTSRLLTEIELAAVTKRAVEFGNDYTEDFTHKPRPFKIRNVRQLTVGVQRTVKIDVHENP